MRSWVEEELGNADLGDARLNRRFRAIVENLSARPGASVPEASGDWASTKATYNFWDCDRIDAEDIRASHHQQAFQRARDNKIVLAIQDTTDLDFTNHRKTKGLGPTSSQPYTQGLKVHSVLGATTTGVPLGLFNQQVWASWEEEFGKPKDRKRSIWQKESQKWLSSLTATELGIDQQTTVITVADREADIYELFVQERQINSELLIRAAQNRKLKQEAGYLFSAMAETVRAGYLQVEINRCVERPTRTANLSLCFNSLIRQPPKHHPQRRELPDVKLNVVKAWEENPPEGVPPIHWLLLTTVAVTSLSEAIECVQWYSRRWLIERYHYVLKSGCNLEKLQLETAARLEKALATYSIVAWRLLWLTYEARVNPDVPCDLVLPIHVWQVLYCSINATTTLPEKPPSLSIAVQWIAQLGGISCSKT